MKQDLAQLSCRFALIAILWTMNSCNRAKEGLDPDGRGKNSSKGGLTEGYGGHSRSKVPETGETDETKIDKLLSDLASSDIDDLDSFSSEIVDLTIKDPVKTLMALDGLPPGTLRDLSLRVVVENFPRDRVETLVEWADNSPLKEDHQLIGLVLPPDGSTLSKKDGIKLINHLVSDGIKDSILTYLGYQYATERGVNTKSAEIQSLDLPPEARRQFMNEFLYGLSYQNPSAALSESLANAGAYDEGAREACLIRAGKNDPATAKSLIVKLLGNAKNREVVKPFVKGWLQRDPKEAAEWVASLSGSSKDLAASEIVSFLVDKGDYDEARMWRDAIGDEMIKKSLRVP